MKADMSSSVLAWRPSADVGSESGVPRPIPSPMPGV